MSNDSADRPEGPARDASEMVNPLRMVFWGVLVIALDFHLTWPGGFRLDLINDVVGAILVLRGVIGLRSQAIGDSWMKSMGFVEVIAWITVVGAVIDHFVLELPAPLLSIGLVVGFLKMLAVLVFCRAMREVCEMYGFERSVLSWRLSSALYLWLYILPMSLLGIGFMISALQDGPRQWNSPLAILLVVPPLAAVIHVLISLYRMTNAAREGDSRSSDDGLPVLATR